MAKNKEQLLKEAEDRNLDVNEDNTVDELKQALKQADENTQPGENSEDNSPAEETTTNPEGEKASEEVEVNENEDGEATDGTTEEGDESPVDNTESIPQNGVTKIETAEYDKNSAIGRAADEARTQDEITFADESNPNQKGRFNGAPTEYDQDGNQRSGGKSYGVSLDHKPESDAHEQNAGEAPKGE